MRQLNWVDVIFSALTAFTIAAGGSLLVIAGSNGPQALNEKAWIMSAIVGAVAAGKDFRSSRGLPPAGDPPLIPQGKNVDISIKTTDSQKP